MKTPYDRNVWSVLGVPIDVLTLSEARGKIEHAVRHRQRLSFVTPNVNWLVRALQDPGAMKQILRADLSLADGAPIVWLARRLGVPIRERVAGSDLFEMLRQDKDKQAVPIRVFFFGGREGAAQAACDVLAAESGRLVPAGWHNPGFGSVEDMTSDSIQNKINQARPDFVLVALGAAKGQAWIEANQAALDAPVIAHLGAVMDFVAGTVRRAPRWMARLGLEWIWRILADPALWRRYWRDGKALLAVSGKRLRRLRQAAKFTGAPRALEVSTVTRDETSILILKGDAQKAYLPALRQALYRFSRPDGALMLDLSAVRSIDAAILGQIHMLQHCMLRHEQPLRLRVPSHLRPALHAAGLDGPNL